MLLWSGRVDAGSLGKAAPLEWITGVRAPPKAGGNLGFRCLYSFLLDAMTGRPSATLPRLTQQNIVILLRSLGLFIWTAKRCPNQLNKIIVLFRLPI